MKRQITQGFNKEKLAFLVVTCILAGLLYYFLTSGPATLGDASPISPIAPASPLEAPNLDARPDVDFFVVPGTISHMIDPRTQQLVNRDRKNPFEPADDFNPLKSKVVADGTALPPLPPLPPPSDPKKSDEKKLWGAIDQRAAVTFMGVVMMNGQSYALLKPREGGSFKRVKVGDVIPEYKYKVTQIDEQAITVVDEDGHTFLLKDSDEDKVAAADEKASGAEDDEMMGPPAPPKKKEEKKPPPKHGSGKKGDKPAGKPAPPGAAAAAQPSPPGAPNASPAPAADPYQKQAPSPPGHTQPRVRERQ